MSELQTPNVSRSEESSILAVRDVAKIYPPQKAVLDQLSFSVAAGELVVLLGLSGSGKTTILRLLAGLDKPTCGSIDRRINRGDGKKPIVSYMPQGDSLLPWRTVIQNVTLFSEVLGGADMSKAREFLAEVGLEDCSRSLPCDLSGGMRRGVALARSLLINFNLLLLDEPLVHLDVGWRNQMVRLIRQTLQARNSEPNSGPACGIVVTHDINEACELADRILVIGKEHDQTCSLIVHEELVTRTSDGQLSGEFVAFSKQKQITELLASRGR